MLWVIANDQPALSLFVFKKPGKLCVGKGGWHDYQFMIDLGFDRTFQLIDGLIVSGLPSLRQL